MSRSKVATSLSLGTIALLLRAALWPGSSHAEIDLSLTVERGSVPRLFSDHMVLQRQVPVPIFGRADPGEPVTVSIASQTKVTTADSQGHWIVHLDPMQAGGPHVLTISGENTVEIDDVLIGEVWVCAGQSNMLIQSAGDFDLEAYPQVRTLRRRDWRDHPAGVPFWFGVRLHEALGVPIGLINEAVHGAALRTWLGNSVFTDADPTVQELISECDRCGRHYRRFALPLQPYAIRGVAWWQGESALRREPAEAVNYRHLLPALLRSWRTDWAIGDFPFVFIQLPTGGGMKLGQLPASLPPSPAAAVPPDDAAAVALRHAFVLALDEPQTAMVISTDIDGGTHPDNREEYGRRFADVALGSFYGIDFPYSGPVYDSMAIEGSAIRIRFQPGTASGLVAEGGPLQGFAIAAADGEFLWANSRIEGEEVVVWHESLLAPTAVRYGWAKDPAWANLFNGAGLGTAPFSTEPASP